MNRYKQYSQYNSVSLRSRRRWKLRVVLSLSVFAVMVFIIFEVNPNPSRAREQDIKLLQLDTLKNIAREKQGVWKISKWKYFEALEPVVISTYSVTPEHILARRTDAPDESKGFWILGYADNDTDDDKIDNFIRLTQFQYENPLNGSLGLSIYLEGNIELDIRFVSNKNKASKTIKISPEGRFFNYGICTEIFKVPFAGQIDEIEIKAVLRDNQAFVAIDKIVLALGSLDKSSSLMYTMLDWDWCQTMGKRYNTVGES